MWSKGIAINEKYIDVYIHNNKSRLLPKCGEMEASISRVRILFERWRDNSNDILNQIKFTTSQHKNPFISFLVPTWIGPLGKKLEKKGY